MNTQKNLGIWLDHSTANLIDLKTKKNHSITSKSKVEALNKSESLMHNKEQQMQS